MKIVIDLGKMKDSLINMYNSFLGHDTKGYFRVTDTPQDLPNPENDTPWAGTIKYSIETCFLCMGWILVGDNNFN